MISDRVSGGREGGSRAEWDRVEWSAVVRVEWSGGRVK